MVSLKLNPFTRFQSDRTLKAPKRGILGKNQDFKVTKKVLTCCEIFTDLSDGNCSEVKKVFSVENVCHFSPFLLIGLRAFFTFF